MKTPIRYSRASGSTKRLVEHLINLGWTPDRRDVVPRRSFAKPDEQRALSVLIEQTSDAKAVAR